ncbi:hypothetical protein CHARACLAT_000015 [Characodon lateralis]|uniref:Uncharacterized protein n=1 Tax=Characodon lateralis TaxID=208331 RepID=A0ABU7D4T0_9TELE|nr:hypothetical protein [Characodon lateralis]
MATYFHFPSRHQQILILNVLVIEIVHDQMLFNKGHKPTAPEPLPFLIVDMSCFPTYSSFLSTLAPPGQKSSILFSPVKVKMEEPHVSSPFGQEAGPQHQRSYTVFKSA